MAVDLRNTEIIDSGWPFYTTYVEPGLIVGLVILLLLVFWQWQSGRYKRWLPFVPDYEATSDRGLAYREILAILAGPLPSGVAMSVHLLQNLKRSTFTLLEELRAFRRNGEEMLNRLKDISPGFATVCDRQGYFYIWHAKKELFDWVERTVDSEKTRLEFADLNSKIVDRDKEIALNKTAATDAATEITALKEKVKELNLAAAKATTDHAAALKVVTDERDALKAAPATTSSPDEVKKLQAKIDRLTKERDKLKGEVKGLTAARP